MAESSPGGIDAMIGKAAAPALASSPRGPQFHVSRSAQGLLAGGEGGYMYLIRPDGSIRIMDGPNNVGKELTNGGAFEAIKAQLVKLHPEQAAQIMSGTSRGAAPKVDKGVPDNAGLAGGKFDATPILTQPTGALEKRGAIGFDTAMGADPHTAAQSGKLSATLDALDQRPEGAAPGADMSAANDVEELKAMLAANPGSGALKRLLASYGVGGDQMNRTMAGGK